MDRLVVLRKQGFHVLGKAIEHSGGEIGNAWMDVVREGLQLIQY